MKKIINLMLTFVCLGTLFLGACTNTASLNYSQRLANTDQYSFRITYTDSTMSEPIYVSCYKAGNNYAYRFSAEGYDNETLSYRQIFVDNSFYEIRERKVDGVWQGEYKKTDGVSITCEKNFMYKYTTYITTGSFLTLLDKGENIQYKGKKCTESEIEYQSAVYAYVFENDTSNLVKFTLTKENLVKKLEFSDYDFDGIELDCFTIPVGDDNGGRYASVSEMTYDYYIS